MGTLGSDQAEAPTPIADYDGRHCAGVLDDPAPGAQTAPASQEEAAQAGYSVRAKRPRRTNTGMLFETRSALPSPSAGASVRGCGRMQNATGGCENVRGGARIHSRRTSEIRAPGIGKRSCSSSRSFTLRAVSIWTEPSTPPAPRSNHDRPNQTRGSNA